MKRISLSILFGFFLAAGATAANEGTLPLRRLGLFIGSNNGGTDRVTLRYAEEDARAMAGVMQELGGLGAEDSLVLLAPTSEDVLTGFRMIGQRAKQAREGARRVEFLLYYSGHSDEEGILLAGERVGYPQIKSAILEVQADVNIAILDSCSSGAFTRLKGGIRQAPFLVDESSQMKGHAYLTSSSADEAAQESDRINGSFFTHYLISGLRGAADSTRDGQVSLNEVYHFAFSETLARTESTQAGPQHPSYNIQLTGTGDLTLTDLRIAPSGIFLEESIEGRLFIRNAQNKLVVELRKDPNVQVDLGLPEGRYTITLDQGKRLYETSVTIRGGRRETLSMRQFTPARKEPTVVRGDSKAEELESRIEEIVREWFGEPDFPEAPQPSESPEIEPMYEEPAATRVPFHLGIVPGVGTSGPGNHIYTFSYNLLVGSSYAVHGAEFASVINITEHEVLGWQGAGVGNILDGKLLGVQQAGVFNIVAGDTLAFQTAGVFNIVQGRASFLQTAGVFNINEGPFSGLLTAGVFNIGQGSLAGIQTAGVFNIQEGPLAGAQFAGVFNRAAIVSGAQVGLVNVSDEVRGAQIGLVNIASGEVRGTQIGLVNISRRLRGMPIGLVSVAQEGGFHLSGWVTEDGLGYVGVQTIAGILYTILYSGFPMSGEPGLFTAGLGLGLHIPVGSFFVDADLSGQHVFQGPAEQWGEGFLTAPYSPVFPTARLVLGVKLFGSAAVFGGLTMDVHIPGATVETPLHVGTPIDMEVSSVHLLVYPKLVFGLRL